MRRVGAESSRRTRPAMTLLELVVTVAVFGVMIAMLMGIFNSTLQARRTVEKHLSVIDRAYLAMDVLVRDLETMHVADSRTYLFVELRDFPSGRATSIAFPSTTEVRVSELLRQHPGLIEIAYLIGPDPDVPDALRVFRREAEVETNARVRQIRTEDKGLVLLVDAVKTFRMEFLSKQAASAATSTQTAPQFVERWDGRFGADTLPSAIRIILTVRSPEANGPEMTIERTVRLPQSNVYTEMLQYPLQKSLGIVR